MSLTTVIVNFTARPGQREALTGFLGKALQNTITKPDCFKAVLVLDDNDDDKFAMVQEWTSADAHQAYAQGLMNNPKFGEAMQMMAHPPISNYYTHHTSGGGEWGGPGHLEMCSDDIDATKAFLSDVFEWQFSEWMPGYQGFWAPGALFGGLRPRMEDAEPSPQTIPYLVVDDLDVRLEAVKAAGGTITVPTQTVPNAGRFFWFIAPGGLPLAVWESAPKG